jgi:hypothetical protein
MYPRSHTWSLGFHKEIYRAWSGLHPRIEQALKSDGDAPWDGFGVQFAQ